ncbi:MAG: YegS/Rv2252/BmrU family lipid kinase [Gemmatimonadetes bacterium]|nr:YegS/Rv2252/BmrU family lipid kinase [Gemmatimonadota bacterium]
MQIVLIINGSKPGHYEELRKQVERLRELGHHVKASVTFEPGDARRMAREGVVSGAELVLVAGGDGTLNEVANGVNDCLGGSAEAAPRMGIIPVGTANDLANALGLPTPVEEAVNIALRGAPRGLNIATVNQRCFLNVSTGGFGAQATRDAATEGKRLFGALAYALNAARQLVGLEHHTGSFTCAEGPIYDGPFVLFAVGNTERTGGGNLITPRANPSDHLLDLCVVKDVSRLELTRLLPALRSGQHLDDPAVVYMQSPAFSVEAPLDLAVNVDGEPLLHSGRLCYGVSPYRLPVLTPLRAAETHT